MAWKSFMFTKQTSSVLVGLCVGIALALILTPLVEEECMFQIQIQNDNRHAAEFEDFEPKLAKPKEKQSKTRKILRPRYYTSELGIRHKLFVAVLSDKHPTKSMLAINKTLAHHVNKIVYFIDYSGTEKLPKNLSIVAFKDERPMLMPFRALKYISEHFVNDYDFFFIMEDTTYVRGMRLMEFVEHTSISEMLYGGILQEDAGSIYCQMGPGILLSQPVVRAVIENLEWCTTNAYSEHVEVNLGRCILHSIGVACNSNIQGQQFRTIYSSSDTTLGELQNLISSRANVLETLTVYPVSEPNHIYFLQHWFAQNEIVNLQKQAEDIRNNIKLLLPKEERNREDWPIGLPPPYQPKDRFDVISWEYFNEREIFMDKESNAATPLSGINLIDVQDIVNFTCQHIQDKYRGKYKCSKLVNGYRRFDSTRGMEYILDMEVFNRETGAQEHKRYEALRPLSKPELVPIPYVTENTRIILVLPVMPEDMDRVDDFTKEYAQKAMEAQDNSALVLVLLYHPESQGMGGSNDIYGDIKLQVTKFGRKYQGGITRISWVSIKTVGNVPNIFGILDIISKKFASHTLYLLCTLGMEVKLDYLNRVRMNTIEGWQVFFPMPFAFYHPGIVRKGDTSGKQELNRNTGRLDEHEFNHASFYGSDYLAGRKLIESEIPIVRIDRDLQGAKHRSIKKTLIEMFLEMKNLHVLRSPEPSLRVKYHPKSCSQSLPPLALKQCENSRSHNMGSKSQLALLLMEQEKRNSEGGEDEGNVPQVVEDGEAAEEDKKEPEKERSPNKEYEDNVNEDLEKGDGAKDNKNDDAMDDLLMQ